MHFIFYSISIFYKNSYLFELPLLKTFCFIFSSSRKSLVRLFDKIEHGTMKEGKNLSARIIEIHKRRYVNRIWTATKYFLSSLYYSSYKYYVHIYASVRLAREDCSGYSVTSCIQITHVFFCENVEVYKHIRVNLHVMILHDYFRYILASL